MDAVPRVSSSSSKGTVAVDFACNDSRSPTAVLISRVEQVPMAVISRAKTLAGILEASWLLSWGFPSHSPLFSEGQRGTHRSLHRRWDHRESIFRP